MEGRVQRTGWGTLAAVWGIVGVIGILALAVVRLLPMALDTFNHELNGLHWLALGATLVFMLYSEGYRGFQKSFSPRVVQRALRLREQATLGTGLLAPLYAVGYFKSTTRLKLTVYGLTAGVVVLVLLVHRVGQPWRGIVDAGVVAGLSWGILATLWCAWGGWRR